jgi:SAM-dependent methyltransferase
MAVTDYSTLVSYYAKRSDFSEEGYDDPGRQADLAVLQERVKEVLQGKRVLEIACGAGYWTQHIAEVADSVFAFDINPALIEAARAKVRSNKVEFAVADAFDLKLDDKFSACFAGFWWSHVKREDQASFIAKLREQLGKDALLVMLDNWYIDDGSMPVARSDAEGNTYQIFKLSNNERCEVLKNFPTDSALRKKLGPLMKDLRILRLEHYWMLTGKLK